MSGGWSLKSCHPDLILNITTFLTQTVPSQVVITPLAFLDKTYADFLIYSPALPIAVLKVLEIIADT